ncbi:MAG: hypothetical protein COA79_16485 [Planctomycetota bacterium]|nr:MAG: hypothetical protein COA79_16485 [Planctomycetota bacterium]
MKVKKIGLVCFLFFFIYQSVFSLPRNVEIEIISDWFKVEKERRFFPIKIKLKNNTNTKKYGEFKISLGKYSWSQAFIVLMPNEKKEISYVLAIDGNDYYRSNININVSIGDIHENRMVEVGDSYSYSSSSKNSLDKSNDILIVSDPLNLGLNAATIYYEKNKNLVYCKPADIPTNQLALSEVDFILIPSSTYQSLSHDMKQVVDTYVSWGGNLIIVDAASGDVKDFGMGRKYFYTVSLQKLKELPTFKKSHALSFYPKNGSTFEYHIADGNSFILFLLLLVFVIIIGPINLFILHRIKRKVWAVFTIPFISFSFVFVMVLFAIFSEGFTGNYQSHSFIIINSENRQAIDISETRLYSPMASSNGIRRKLQSVSYPIAKHLGYSEKNSRSYQVEYEVGAGQYLRGDYYISRVDNLFKTYQALDIKQRFEIKENVKGIKLLNGFNDELKIVVYDKKEKKYYSSLEPWKTGENKLMSLILPDQKKAFEAIGLPDVYDYNVTSYMNLCLKDESDFTIEKRNSRYIFIATGKKNPFYKVGVSSVNMQDSHHVIVGELK